MISLVPTVLRGNAYFTNPGTPLPARRALRNSARLSSASGLPPPHSPRDRIVVDVVDFLPHHCIAFYPFRMHPLLPELIPAIAFMAFLIEGELIENALYPILFEKRE